MITTLIACLLAVQPLVVTGNDTGLWFIGDREPGFPRAQHALCTRVTAEKYEVMQSLLHRPVVMGVDAKAVWFVDAGEGISLYSMRLPQSKESETPRPDAQQGITLHGYLETELQPTDLVVLAGEPVVAFGGSTLILFTFTGNVWESLPTLNEQDASIAILQDQLIAAVPHDDGITMWYLHGEQWERGDVIALEGQLLDLITLDDWPILVLDHGETVHVVGLQRGDPIAITSLKKPKGRWGVARSSTGLSVVGVERIGTTTVIDIGWPSGDLSDPIVLDERKESLNPLFSILTFVAPLVMLMLMFSMIRRIRQKQSK